MPSVVEWVRASGLPPAAGISYALNTPDWLLVTRIARSSGENDAPTIEVVFMNCSIVYRGTGRTGRARCAAAALGMALGSASSSRITRPDEGGQRTGRSSEEAVNVAPGTVGRRSRDAPSLRHRFCPWGRADRVHGLLVTAPAAACAKATADGQRSAGSGWRARATTSANSREQPGRSQCTGMGGRS